MLWVTVGVHLSLPAASSPHLQMPLPGPAPSPQQAQGGTVGNTTLFTRAKRQASPAFLCIKDPLSLEIVDSREVV